MKRLMIYHHYDVNDVVDDHIVYQLQAYCDLGMPILFISNSALPSRQKKKIAHLVDACILRKNEGFDFGAWKELILERGPHFLSSFDELILTNCTCYGPFFPLCEMFDKMARQTCDYWMLTNHSLSRGVPSHGQSYFIVLKKVILNAPAFWSFWETLPPLSLLDEAIWQGEIRFSRTLATAGFEGAVYYDAGKEVPDYELGHFEPYCINSADLLMLKARVPLIKVKAVAEWFSRSYSIAPRIFDALSKTKTNYPQHLIINHIRRTQSLSCQRFLPESVVLCPEGIPADKRQARIAYLASFKDVSMGEPPFAETAYTGDLLALVQDEAMAHKLGELIQKQYPCFCHSEIRVKAQTEPKGFSLLSAFSECLERYDYVVMLKNNGHKLRSDALTSRWAMMRTPASLSLGRMVAYAVTLFEQEERLGLMLPCLPSLCVVSNDLPKRLDPNVVQFLQACGIMFPRESHVPVLAVPPGYCVVRASVLKRLGSRVAGHTLESGVTEDQILEMLPYIAQAFGYYLKQVTTPADVLMNARLYEDFICSVHLKDDLLYYKIMSFRELLAVIVKAVRVFLVFNFPRLTRWATRIRCLRRGIPWGRG